MKQLLVLLCLLVLPLAAQEQPKPTAEQLQQVATIMRQQRDALSQQLLDTQSQMQLLAVELDAAKKQIADLTKKLADLEKPKASEKVAEAKSESKTPPKS